MKYLTPLLLISGIAVASCGRIPVIAPVVELAEDVATIPFDIVAATVGARTSQERGFDAGAASRQQEIDNYQAIANNHQVKIQQLGFEMRNQKVASNKQRKELEDQIWLRDSALNAIKKIDPCIEITKTNGGIGTRKKLGCAN